jgi:hypothetical protein
VNRQNEHGGARPGAGRKPKADELNLINTMDSILPIEDVWNKVSHLVMNGDMAAIKIWIEYRLGKPKQSMDITSGGDRLPTMTIEYVKPNES